ncbi:hypothetical protein G5C51_37640 [Streptomyces sp. A7024]|uniref:DUF2269 domain-containing protein n=1 Tax=Streptomyces coryli TaxID=1128680 RepID=A0A6G4UD46_9ACTN|nr:hypothetical protein [Streptomyces coryli]NGN69596.1 hypothetical protein [Streptomyces coryli]
MITEAPPTARARTSWRMRPTTRKLVLTLHVIASVALLGEVWGLTALNLYVTTSGGMDEDTARTAYDLMTVLVFAGGMPLSLTALATGILLGLGTKWGVTLHFWTFAKLVLNVSVIVIGITLFQPEAMAAAYENGTHTTGQQWSNVAAVGGQLAMLIAATALSVYKPKGRLRRAR